MSVRDVLVKDVKLPPPPPAEMCLKIYQAAKANKITADKLSGNTCAKMVYRIAQNCTEEEFMEFTQKNILPPVKLTAEEQELLRGGIAVSTVVGIIAIASGVCWLGSALLSHYGY